MKETKWQWIKFSKALENIVKVEIGFKLFRTFFSPDLCKGPMIRTNLSSLENIPVKTLSLKNFDNSGDKTWRTFFNTKTGILFKYIFLLLKAIIKF